MSSYARRLAVTLVTGAALVAVPAGTAGAATQTQDGLVNVAVGDVTINDAVDLAVAAQVVAQLCNVRVGPIAVLGQAIAVDNSGVSRTVCTSEQGPVTITQ